MKAILYVVSLLAILAGAYFSYTTIQDFEDQQQAIEDVQGRSKRVSAQADKTEKESKDETETLREAQSEKAVVQASIDKLSSDDAGLRREIGELDAKLEEQQQTLVEAQNAVDQAKEVLAELGVTGPVDMDTIGSTIRDLEDQKKAAVQELEEIQITVEGATKAVADKREELGRLAQRKAERNARFRRNSMQSVVTAVDQKWGFVVIGAGTNSGFKPSTRLIIQRDGRRIAEVKPSSVEASQTIAEIDFDTMTPGVMIQPGDRVILRKTAAN